MLTRRAAAGRFSLGAIAHVQGKRPKKKLTSGKRPDLERSEECSERMHAERRVNKGKNQR